MIIIEIIDIKTNINQARWIHSNIYIDSSVYSKLHYITVNLYQENFNYLFLLVEFTKLYSLNPEQYGCWQTDNKWISVKRSYNTFHLFNLSA